MPIGVIVNVAAVVFGGLTGSILGNKLSEELKEYLSSILALCALCMGISSVVLMKNLPPVVLSIILGSLLGFVLKVGLGIQKLSGFVLDKVMKNADQQKNDMMLTAVVLFCASATGIYGTLDAGMTGNHTLLIAKSMADFFAAMIFACQLGKATVFIGVPQFAILISLFALSKVIVPLTTESMVADFKACGGFVLIATGLRMMKLKPYPVADMIPAMVLVMPMSFLWVTYLLPLIL